MVATVRDVKVREQALLEGLAREVRRLRKLRGLTREALGKLTKISERFLADIETARANPSLLLLHELSKALGTSLQGLFGAVPAAGRHPIVALLGLRGAGKSAVGRALATRLSRPFVELDERVAKLAGLSLTEIFEVHGERFYRDREHEALLAVLAEAEATPLVLAVGGGLVTSSESFALLQAHAHTVWLQATPEEHWRRVIAQGDLRPMAKDAKSFQQLGAILSEREPLYRRAELTVATSDADVAAIAERLALHYAFLAPSANPA